MSTTSHKGEFQFGTTCEVTVIKKDELGNDFEKIKEFEPGKNYWIDTLTYKENNLLEILFADGTVGKNISQDSGAFSGKPTIIRVAETQSQENQEPTEDTAPPSEEKNKWF